MTEVMQIHQMLNMLEYMVMVSEAMPPPRFGYKKTSVGVTLFMVDLNKWMNQIFSKNWKPPIALLPEHTPTCPHHA